MSISDIYAHEAELADWVEMLMRWMQRKKTDGEMLYMEEYKYCKSTLFDLFAEEYASTASDMKRWLEARHKE